MNLTHMQVRDKDHPETNLHNYYFTLLTFFPQFLNLFDLNQQYLKGIN